MNWFILFLGIMSNAFASVLIKVAVSESRKLPSLFDPMSIITNWPLLLGLIMYVATFLFYISALSRFPLNVAHPIFTAGAIAVVALLSVLLFKEQLYWSTILGISLIIIGVILISAHIS